jgi:hypothetical protein
MIQTLAESKLSIVLSATLILTIVAAGPAAAADAVDTDRTADGAAALGGDGGDLFLWGEDDDEDDSSDGLGCNRNSQPSLSPGCDLTSPTTQPDREESGDQDAAWGVDEYCSGLSLSDQECYGSGSDDSFGMGY